jgi:ribosomal protein L13E
LLFGGDQGGRSNQYAGNCHCAGIRISYFRRTGLSADDRRIAVLNTAFEAVQGIFRAFTVPERIDSAWKAFSPCR